MLTAHSDQIELLGLHYGDSVIIEKGGEIIPKIVGVDSEKRTNGAAEVTFPGECPECGTALVRNEGEANHFCPNYLHCPPQIIRRIIHFVSRKAMDIEGLGEETVELLWSNGLIHNVADLYTIKHEQLHHLRGWVTNLLQTFWLTGKIAYCTMAPEAVCPRDQACGRNGCKDPGRVIS